MNSTKVTTVTPWRVVKTNNGTMIAGAVPGYILEMRHCHTDQDIDADAALIVASVNGWEAQQAHIQELRVALSELLADAEIRMSGFSRPLEVWYACRDAANFALNSRSGAA